MKRITALQVTRTFIVPLLLILFSEPAFAQGGFSFYFFGQNIKSFQNSNWMEVAVGAFASICIHELGHALYLESRGKAWHLDASVSSGFAIRTDESLTDAEMRNFGRAGFALQSLVGTGLTLFRQTRDLDFTTGWVAMNAVQVISYQSRRHGNDDDFALIDQGGGDGDLEFAAFSLLSVNNLMRLGNDPMIFASKSGAAPDFNFSGRFDESEFDGENEFALYPDSRFSMNDTSAFQLPPPDPPNAMENSSWINSPKLADANNPQIMCPTGSRSVADAIVSSNPHL
jgi:hypothetical protein